MYVLDEPSIGLHQRDNDRLLTTLKHLRDIGNTVIVVEHDEEAIHAADYVVDMGPGAGEHGGKVVAEGTPRQIQANRRRSPANIFPARPRSRSRSAACCPTSAACCSCAARAATTSRTSRSTCPWACWFASPAYPDPASQP